MKYESFETLSPVDGVGLSCVTDQHWERQQKEVLRRPRQTSSTSQILQEMLQKYFTITPSILHNMLHEYFIKCSTNTSEKSPQILQKILHKHFRKCYTNTSENYPQILQKILFEYFRKYCITCSRFTSENAP